MKILSRYAVAASLAVPMAAFLASFSWGWELHADQDSVRAPAKKLARQEVEEKQPTFKTVSERGKVVWLSEALKRRFSIEVDPDATKQQVALETEDGRLIPLVKDFRGRGFHLDDRLHEISLELQLRIYDQSPAAQIVQVYSLRDGHKFELDYWCDICAIPMYELKACECCQGPIRLRERKVDDQN
ncbi:MAG: hypothetical protein MPJ50_02730 [Pirellulales bacterium]|nr:hypothetical protein [Pirellulales bacterium]